MRRLKPLCLLFCLVAISCSQKNNTTRVFIGDNFSLEVDTSQFHETYFLSTPIFRYNVDDSNYIEILTLQEKLASECNDSIIDSYSKELLKKIKSSSLNDTVDMSLSETKSKEGFYYFFMSGSLKSGPKEFGSNIAAFKCYDKTVMKIICYSGKKSIIRDKELESVFKNFIKTINYYTDNEVYEADSLAIDGLKPNIKVRYAVGLEGSVWVEGSEKPIIIDRVVFNRYGNDNDKVFYPNKSKRIEFTF